MKITEDLVRHVADLARLELSREELQTFTGQLAEILGYVGQLEELDPAGVEGTSQVLPLDCPTRTDAVEVSGERDAILSQAPQPGKGPAEGDYFVVPKIID